MGADDTAPAPIPERILAEFNSYDGMLDAMRARAKERQLAVTSSAVAAMAGLPDYYLAKLLAVHPVRRIGMISLGPILGVLGLKLLMIEDPEAIAKFTSRLPKRNEKRVHDSGAITFKFSRRYMQKIGRNGARLRWDRERHMLLAKANRTAGRNRSLSSERRREIARKAAAARWKKRLPARTQQEAAIADTSASRCRVQQDDN